MSARPCRIGVDMVAVADVDASLERFGGRYLVRVFTPHEVESCVGRRRAERLAARFAAKEAVVKVLRPDPDDALPWCDIEIWRHTAGWCEVRLHGRAARIARRAGLGAWSVSMSHERGMACAAVVAQEDER